MDGGVQVVAWHLPQGVDRVSSPKRRELSIRYEQFDFTKHCFFERPSRIGEAVHEDAFLMTMAYKYVVKVV
jgi:hypothetical protein